MSAPSPAVQAALARLRDQFLGDAVERRDRLAAQREIAATGAALDWALIHRDCHKLAGAGGMFDYHEITNTARALEHQVAPVSRGQRAPFEDSRVLLEFFDAALAELDSALADRAA